MASAHRPFSLITRFSADRSGAIAILFGLLIVPLILAVGVFVDFSRGLIARERLNNAIDAAALAIGASAGQDLSDEEITAMAQSYFDANYPPAERGFMEPLQVEVDEDTVRIAGSGKVDTILMKIAGFDEMNIAANTEVTRKLTHIELIMALDNTGSMAGSKMTALKSASKGLVDILFSDESNSQFVKIGLVPFSASVNIGADKRNSGWMDVNRRQSIHGEDFSPRQNLFTVYSGLNNRNWAGCVMARPAPYDTNDTPPAASTANTLFVPYLAPDEAGGQNNPSANYCNSYLADSYSPKSGNGCDGNASIANRQRCPYKYVGNASSGDQCGGTIGPHFNCPAQAIMPLTNIKSEIVGELDDMEANGSTVISEGLAWAWRAISPGEPYTEGVAYDDDETVKAIVLLTDGENDVGGGRVRNHNNSFFSAFGYASSPARRLGSSNGSQAETTLNNKTATLCNNVKAAGIRLYTITFMVTNTATRNLMRNCATETSMYYNTSSGSDLGNVFADIAKGLSELRISK